MPTAPTLNCAACGGPVSARDLTCRYCGSQLADLACPECFAHAPRGATHCGRCGASLDRRSAPAALGDCPECGTPLRVTEVGPTTTYDCGTCGGLWLQREAFLHLVQDREVRQPFLDHPAAPAAAPSLDVRYRPCPACRTLMNRSNYARVSGVIVDTCKSHGVWFDRDELGRVLRFIEQGGLQKAAEREKFDLQAERARVREAARASAGAVDGNAWTVNDLQGAALGHLLLGAAWTLFDP